MQLVASTDTQPVDAACERLRGHLSVQARDEQAAVESLLEGLSRAAEWVRARLESPGPPRMTDRSISGND